ncbi:hypothetical protein HBB16_20360 [Pseudonocardia sp. MCCB 268]|nr:hypothetical protein [Pseudonocardia cytotoxica]
MLTTTMSPRRTAALAAPRAWSPRRDGAARHTGVRRQQWRRCERRSRPGRTASSDRAESRRRCADRPGRRAASRHVLRLPDRRSPMDRQRRPRRASPSSCSRRPRASRSKRVAALQPTLIAATTYYQLDPVRSRAGEDRASDRYLARRVDKETWQQSTVRVGGAVRSRSRGRGPPRRRERRAGRGRRARGIPQWQRPDVSFGPVIPDRICTVNSTSDASAALLSALGLSWPRGPRPGYRAAGREARRVSQEQMGLFDADAPHCSPTSGNDAARCRVREAGRVPEHRLYNAAPTSRSIPPSRSRWRSRRCSTSVCGAGDRAVAGPRAGLMRRCGRRGGGIPGARPPRQDLAPGVQRCTVSQSVKAPNGPGECRDHAKNSEHAVKSSENSQDPVMAALSAMLDQLSPLADTDTDRRRGDGGDPDRPDRAAGEAPWRGRGGPAHRGDQVRPA